MRSEPFEFAGAAGQRLAGRLDRPDGPVAGWALFAHCFTCGKDALAAVRIARGLAARGWGVLRFDFTGLGQSGGEFAGTTFSGRMADIAAAAAAMAAAGHSVSLLVGHSLGGAAVLAAGGGLPTVRAVATLGAPFDVAHVTRLLGPAAERILAEGEAEVALGGRPFRLRRAFLDDLAAQDQADRIATLGRALLVLHSPQDHVVDVHNAGLIFAAAAHPKSFVCIDGADHLLTGADDAAYVAAVVATWAARYTGARPPAG